MPHHKPPTNNQVRIIGGKWRSRKLTFPAVDSLRPTPDRVRETLFNWLTPAIYGARCLDPFAGSGALGFEALSRGALSIVMVDQSGEAIASLRHNAEKLAAAMSADIIWGRFPDVKIAVPQNGFDIVFLDPPFHQQLIKTACQHLDEQGMLNPNALIYIEAEIDLQPLPLPPHWEILKAKQAGQVSYYLVSPGQQR